MESIDDKIITLFLVGVIIFVIVLLFIIRKSIKRLKENINNLESELKRPPSRKTSEEEDEYHDPNTIRVSRLQPGDILLEDVMTKDDKRLLERGTELTAKNIARLKQWGITTVKIER